MQQGSGSPKTSCQSATSTSLNLFPTKENNMKPQNLIAMNLLSQQIAYRPHLPMEEIPNSGNSSVTKEPKGAQLTIFYAGQVIVFDDFPPDKAKEIMSFASKGISQSPNNYAYTLAQSQSSFPANMVRSCASSSSSFPFNVNIFPSTGNNSVQEHPQAPSRPVVCELPLARKASLHLFLEKRKDRIAARAPYQTSNPMAANKVAESMSWFALAPQSPQDKSESSSSVV